MDASRLFDKIKPLCTSLFKSPSPSVLATLYQTLQSAPRSAFTPSLIEYTFFPISHLLRKPPIPNHLLEQIFLCLSVLCAHWDLSHSPGIWSQLVILCNLAEGKDEETRLAACLTLHALFPNLAALEPRNLPIVGKTLDTLLGYALSPNHALQTTALEVLLCIVGTFPPDHVPAVLPGVVSKMVRVAMGDKTTSRAIGLALAVLGKVLERGIGDEVCIESGAIRDYTTLNDLVPTPEGPTHSGGPTDSGGPPSRTPTWFGATSPQVHISLLSLSPLSTHPNPLTRRALVELCTTLTQSCARTLEHSQPLLVSHLLLLAYPALALEHAVPEDAQKALDSLKGVDVRVVAGIVAKALSLLPHRLSHTHQSTASALSKQLVSACHVLPSSTVGALLGPGGGIEKWGRTLLAVIRFDSSEHRIVPLLQQLTSAEPVEEVQPRLEGLDTQTTNDIASLFRALGKRAGDQGVFAIEWFVSAGVGGSVAGLWCALWLLRGIQSNPERPSTRVLKASKWIAKTLAEMWDDQFLPAPIVQEERLEVTEYVKGLNPLTTLLDRPSQPRKTNAREDKRLHSDMAIRLIVTCHTVLANSAPTISPPTNPTYSSSIAVNPSITLLQYTIYPMLVQAKGLNEVSAALGYARMENMLLANFDYALEAVARRVSVFGMYAAGLQHTPSTTSPSISIQALSTLRTLIHLIGSQIVSRASDVIDECFDRLDDFHGYERVVGALVGVLAEVVEVVGREDDGSARDFEREVVSREQEYEGWEGFLKWWNARGKEHNWEADLGNEEPKPEPDEPPPLPPTQSLTRQIIARCTYFLTHPSPHIRSQILHLLTTAAPTLRASALLPTIHASWPFILNRMGDGEVWVVVACARLVERLVECVGEFMARRVWEDVWPRFEKMLKAQADMTLVKRGPAVSRGYEAYGPRALADLHVSILGTLAKAVYHVEPSDQAVWSLLLLARRFLRRGGRGEKREEVYAAAVEMYKAVGKKNPDVVWLVLEGTKGNGLPAFLKWDGEDVFEGVEEVLRSLD